MTDLPADRPKPRSRPSRRATLPEEPSGLEQLTYREAQAALERSLVELQSDDLDVERMMELYQQACSYADRCDALLQSVEADVMLWDPDHPDAPTKPLIP